MLSRRVHWVDRAPIVYRIGDIYIRAEMLSGFMQWFRVDHGARSRRRWWMDHILHNTAARAVEIIYPV